MSDEPLDYAVLISLSMPEEAEVMASMLRAEGIDAFVGNRHHANYNWGYIIALGGMQVLVPRAKLQEAKDVIRTRIKEAAENPEGEPVRRRDRWKAWAVIAYSFVIPVLLSLLLMWLLPPEPDLPPAPIADLPEPPTYFSAPAYLSDEAQRAVLSQHCLSNPSESVVSREDGVGYVMPCSDVLVPR